MKMTHKNTIEVLAANAISWTFTIADVNDILTTISLILAIGFTLYKFFQEKKKK